ncbi:glycosyltransferase [Methylobacterium sp. ID0610]|uniref:glycosyltransferase n=1 Tax=Methylobacterium carpenticola TaxID=3344827 RepID=UPI0036C919E0
MSLDLFDTVIKRKYLAVNEVHDTVSAYLLARLGQYGTQSPGHLTLTRYNIGNFLKMSPHAAMEEPSLGAVWAHVLASLRGRSAGDATIIDDVIAFEFDLELQNLDLVPGAHDLLTRLRAAGKRVVAVSDMYFSQVQIETILDRLGILPLFEKVYVSVDVGLTKQTGRLFRHVLADLGLSPADLHHVGDNPHSDIAMAREIGLSVTQVEQHELLHIERPVYGRRPDIHDEISDLIKIFLLQVLFRALNNGTDRIYFMSRDGLLLHEVLRRWDWPLVGRHLDRFPKSDLFLSRAMSCWLALNFQGDWLTQAVGFAFWLCHGSATPGQLSTLLGIEEVPPGLEDKVYDSASDTVVVVHAYRAAGLAERIRAAVLEKRRLAEGYLTEAGLFSGRHITLCDIGYSGTVARDLNSFFLQESLRPEAPSPPKVELNLISTNGNYGRNAVLAQPYIHFGSKVILPADRLPDALADSFAWLEMFFKHPSYGPLRGYVRRGGRVEPDYDAAPPAGGFHPGTAVLAASAPKPEDIVLLWMASQEFWGQFVDPLVARFTAPDLDTVSQMQAEIYEEDAVSGRKRSVILVRPDLSAAEIYQLAKRKDYWIPGSILASAQQRTQAPAEAGPGEAPAAVSGTPAVVTAAARPRRTFALRSLEGLLRTRTIRRSISNRFRPGRREIGRPAIDHAFYRTHHPDLGSFDDAALERHYTEYGREEGRFANPEALIAHLEREHGALPADFDAQTYETLYSDLAFAHEWQLKVHYLVFGRREGRTYHPGYGLIDREFEDLVRAGDVPLSAEERAAWERGIPARQLIFRRAGLKPGPWLDLLHVGEFQALNHAWAGRLRSRMHAIATFLDRGVARLAPLSLGARFDPAYYAKRHPDLAEATPEQAYRHWLQHGAGQGEVACEDDRLFQLVGERVFPAAFRPDRFAERHLAPGEAGETVDRVELLARFLDGAYTAYTDLAEGPGAARLWEIAGRRALVGGRLDEARRAFENALESGGAPGRIWHQLGDVAAGQHRLHDALACYERGVAAPTPDRWSFVNGARIAADLTYFPQALDLVRAGAAPWAGKEPWRRVRDHVYEAWFEHTVRTHRGDDALLAVVAELTRLIGAELPSTFRLAAADGPALILSGRERRELPPEAVARAEAAFGAEMGRTARLFPLDEAAGFTGALPGAGLAVFHETRPRPATLRAVQAARALGIPTVYWAGPLDGADVPAFRDAEAARLAELLGSRLARAFMALCDQGMATLPAAAAVLERATAGGTARLVGRLARSFRRPRLPAEALTLAVRLPPHGHDEALARAWAAVEALLSQRATVSVLLDRSAVPPQDLARFGARLRTAQLRATDATSVWLLQEADGFIDFGPEAPEGRGEPLAGRLDAAAWGLPVLAVGEAAAGDGGPTIPWQDAVPALLRFADDPAWREAASRAARTGFASRFLAPPAPARAPQPGPARPRILYANVFFPPQTVGGATRVLKDNIDYILDHHHEAFDLAVLTSDDENDRAGAARVDDYRGIPVLRIATPQEIDMDWRPYNAQVYRHALTALETVRPDLVHIHCLQRLSVAVAEACRTLGIPYVVTLHDAWWLSDFSFLIDEDGRLATPAPDLLAQPHSARIGLTESASRGAQLRDALGAAAARLAVSAPFAEIYRACGFDVAVVANGVSRLEPAPRAPAGPRVRLAHLGGTQHHKGAYLIEAALRQNAFRNLSLTLVDLFRDDGDVSHTIWGTTPVTIVGKIPSGRIEETYARSDVVLAPSIWPESFGLVSREALSAGCWVVASRLGAMGEAVVEGENGFLVDVTRPDDLARVLHLIDSDPETYTRSPARRPDLRTADDQSRDLVALYRRMLAGEP